ncbi:hypothetical protein NDU88_007329 [Pleurodeles waltl]|uniref:Uncharacterized protein n=1 Tax=Pleurodeles waltl TaxID=8319 RepID=A0AAV7P0J2_PLEWA|nr:hypothetical protein NDU88_007329 [Pleurodeles waltl]
MRASDPYVLRAGTNHIPLLGDGRQRQRSCAVTWASNCNEEEDRSEEEEDRRDDLGGASDGSSKGKEEKRSRRYGKDSLDGGQTKTSREDRENVGSVAGRHRGPGGHALDLRPRSGKIMAPASAWAELSSIREVEGRIRDGEGGEE